MNKQKSPSNRFRAAAEKALQQAVQRDPNSVEAQFYLGVVLSEQQGDRASARKAELIPHDARSRRLLESVRQRANADKTEPRP